MTPEPPKSPTTPPSPNGANKRRSNLMFTLSLLCKTIPDIATAIVSGPERPNRPRGLDIFIRFFRKASKHKEMDVYRARSILNTLNKLGEKQKQPALKNTDFVPVSWTAQLVADDTAAAANGSNVNVRSTLPKKYPNRCAFGNEWPVSAEWTTPNDPALEIDTSKVILFLHGGAYTFSSVASYRHFVAPMAKRFQRRVFNVEYRLAPESHFPDAIHDAVSAYVYLTQFERISPSNILLMGDSAGGNLAMVTLLFLRDHGYPLPSGAILLSPWSDLRHNLPSYHENARFDYINPFDDNPDMNPVRLLVGEPDYYPMVTSEPLLSPILDKGNTERPLPPMFVCSGGDEILLDENILLAANLARPGVSQAVIHEIYEHQIHVFPFLAPSSKDTKRFWSRALEFVENLADTNPTALAIKDKVSQVEVVLMRNGELASRGFSETWHTRWGGIKATKSLDWDPDSWPVDGTQLLIAKPDALPAPEAADSNEVVDEESAMLEGVVPGEARAMHQQPAANVTNVQEETTVETKNPPVPPSS